MTICAIFSSRLIAAHSSAAKSSGLDRARASQLISLSEEAAGAAVGGLESPEWLDNGLVERSGALASVRLAQSERRVSVFTARLSR